MSRYDIPNLAGRLASLLFERADELDRDYGVGHFRRATPHGRGVVGQATRFVVDVTDTTGETVRVTIEEVEPRP